MRALVRPPSDAYARCIRTDSSRRIDPGRAKEQHRAYREALRACGVEVVELPPEETLPDACFVEDSAIVIGRAAVICRPGAAERRGETRSVEAALERTHSVRRIERGFLDGGDVILSGKTAFVGLSQRTDALGAAKLERIFEPLDIGVHRVPVPRYLHLKCVATPLDDKTILQLAGTLPRDSFPGREVYETEERLGANVLALGTRIVVSASAPGTARFLAERGHDIHAVDIAEFEAGDAGPTCLSILFDGSE